MNVICTLLTPIAAKLGLFVLIVMRILEGVGGGVSFPAEHTLISQWAPVNERSTISSIVYAGTALGTVISMLSSGVIADNFGWEAIFYIQGGVSSIWFILWIFLASDNPSIHKYIDQNERDFIVSSLNSGGGGYDHSKPQKIPWLLFFKSSPFLGIVIAHICNNWGFYMLLIELPIYMNGVMKFNIKENAVFTAAPFFTLWLFSIVTSKSLDSARGADKISTTTARKVATVLSSLIPICCLTALCFVGCNRMAAVIIAGVAVTSKGAMFSGFLSNHIDLSVNFAGILVAITNTFATIPGIVVPFFVGKLTHSDVSFKVELFSSF
jgi:MFS transporter, ACS family, solute carrier family 17 (sodium-dependent inorganic phosphate cotransporter), other